MKTDFFGIAPLLQVYDMPTAVRFYRDLLGFELLNQSRDGEEFDWCLLSRSGTEIMLNTMYESEHRPSQPDENRTAAHSDIGCFSLAVTWIVLTNICEQMASAWIRRGWLRTECGSSRSGTRTGTGSAFNGLRMSIGLSDGVIDTASRFRSGLVYFKQRPKPASESSWITRHSYIGSAGSARRMRGANGLPQWHAGPGNHMEGEFAISRKWRRK